AGGSRGGCASQAAGRLDESISRHEKPLKQRRATLGAEHPDTLAPMNSLGAAYLAAGRPGEGLPLVEHAFERQTATLGPEHPDTPGTMGNRAAAYHAARRGAAAPALAPLVQGAGRGHRRP